ncbi:hypothetical protein GCM10027269_78830 [Kribbella endophytica]
MLGVPAYRPLVDPESLGEIADATRPTALQQFQQGEHAGSRPRHTPQILTNTGRMLSGITPSLFTEPRAQENPP